MWGAIVGFAGMLVGLVLKKLSHSAFKAGKLEAQNEQLNEDATAARRANLASSGVDDSPDGLRDDPNNRL